MDPATTETPWRVNGIFGADKPKTTTGLLPRVCMRPATAKSHLRNPHASKTSSGKEIVLVS